jgi:hypothetical protein
MQEAELREYRAIVWPKGRDDVPGERVTLVARDLEHAEELLLARFGEEIVYSLWNEEDAKKLR